MKQEEIKARQNEIHMLKIQFSAKGYYNAAEKMGNLSWFCCVLSALTFLIPDSAGVACLLLAPIICDILAFFFSVSQNSLVLKAASFRRYFDAYVLDIDNNYSKHEIEKFRGDAEEYCLKHKRACDIQIVIIPHAESTLVAIQSTLTALESSLPNPRIGAYLTGPPISMARLSERLK